MNSPDHSFDDDILDHLQSLEPTVEDLAAVEDEVLPEELKKKNLKKGLGKEGKKDDIQLMLEKLCETPLLSREDERTLAHSMAQGDAKARETFIMANQRLVISIAKRYRGLGLEFDDLISNGNTGLLHAVNKYDGSRGFKFSTYATWLIREAITRALTKTAREIRIPEHIVANLYKLRREEQRFEVEHGEKPSNAKLAKKMKVTEDEITFLKKARKHPERLNAPRGISDDEDRSSLVTCKEGGVDLKLLFNEQRAAIEKALIQPEYLNEREWTIFQQRVGIGCEQMKPREIASVMGTKTTKIKGIINKIRRALEFHENEKLLSLLDGKPKNDTE